jgi:uncharacterized protein YndB with AHSA1/START domain
MKHVNTKAPVQSTATILINATSEKVWEVLTDIDRWPLWYPEIRRAKINGPLEPGTTFAWRTGGLHINSTLHIVEPHLHFGWSGKSVGLFAIHNWTLRSVDGKTQVSVAESMEGFVASLFKKKLNKTLEKQMHTWLMRLRTECEK